MGDGEVANKGAVGVDDGQVGVVTLEGGEEGAGDGVVGGQGQGGRGVEVFYRCLVGPGLVSTGDFGNGVIVGLEGEGRKRTPR